MAAHLLSPEILQWNFNIQRELPGEVHPGDRLRGHARRTPVRQHLCQSLPSRWLAAIPTRGDIEVRDNSGDSIYHALQVQADRKFSHGFLLRASYTFSKMIDDSSEIFTPGANLNGVLSTWSSYPVVQYPTPRGTNDRSVSDFDHRHRLELHLRL